MRRFLVTALIVLLAATFANAQETYFGKNKVRYRNFEWSYIQTRHFDIYFYGDGYSVSKFAADVLEEAYLEISEELNYNLQDRVPVFVYNSHNDMQQTNITTSLLSEGIGGFTESFKNRIAIPFTGSYEDFRHVLHHELTHAVINNMMFGHSLSSLISRNRLFNLPHWFAEGYAEYSSRHGWDYNSDMFMRDATINNYLVPPEYLAYNYFAYRQGQAMVKYIVDEFGEDKLNKILQKGKIMLSLDRAMESALGITMEEFWKGFSKEMKRRYWPSIALRQEPEEIAKQLTKARKDGSYFNEKPTFAPDGDKIAIFTDRSDYTEITLISPYDGKRLKRLVKSERSGDLESLHAWVSGLSFSPNGESMVFVAKSKGKESLFFVRVDNGDVYKKVRLHFDNIVNPVWSPDSSQIAFSALLGPKRDIYTYRLEDGKINQITDDRYDDMEPSWLPNSSALVFSSDRPHPQNPVFDAEGHPYLNSSKAYMPGDFEYGTYNIFQVNLTTKKIEPINVGPGHNRLPMVSPDGHQLSFISNRNGIDNIYIGSLDTTEYYAITDVLTGITHASWSPTGDKIVFAAFNQGAYDIFLLEEMVPAGEDGVLAETGFTRGDYDLIKRPDRLVQVTENDNPVPDNGTTENVTDDSNPAEVLADIDSEADSTSATADLATVTDEPTDNPTLATVVDTTEATPVDASDSTDTVTVPANEAVKTDTTQVAATDDTTPEEEAPTINETGIYDDEYVYVGSADDMVLDSVLQEVHKESDSTGMNFRRKEPAKFDSIPPRLASGEFKINRYKAKLTTDYVGGGFSYDTFFGMRGQTVFLFSDHLGNHQLYLATDFVNSLDQSYVQVFYFNNKHRTSLGIGGFHTKNFYEDSYNYLFSDRFYGIQSFASYPFSLFSRVEAMVSQVFIDRKYYDRNLGDDRPNRSSEVTSVAGSYVFDNVLWGYTGPVNGRRFKLTLDAGKNFFKSGDIDFYSAGFDYRKYWHFDRQVSMAVRVSGGASFGSTPKQYFVGGTTNWIGSRTLDATVYEVENLYFADVVTPLRGKKYYGISGDRYALLNWELRFPMVQYFAMKYPLPLVLSNISGVIFYDMGAAWFGSNFKGGTSEGGHNRLNDIKAGFGFGARVNLFGFALLRYDIAWETDYYRVSDKPTTYFSFGADF